MIKISDPQLKAILEVIDRHHIKTDQSSNGLYAFNLGIISIACTQNDNPGGAWRKIRVWEHLSIVPSKANKLNSGLAHCRFLYATGGLRLIGFTLKTNAYNLVAVGDVTDAESTNRPEDIAWARSKLEWLWQQAFPGEAAPVIQIEQPEEQAYDSEAVADLIAYHAYGPGKLIPQLSAALRACGPGWHRLQAIAAHLPNRTLTKEHRSALWSMLHDGEVMARPNHEWPQANSRQEFRLPD